MHHHFAAKADLTTVVAQRYVEGFTHSLESLDRSQTKHHERLMAYAQVFQANYGGNRLCLCGMLGAESETLPASVRVQLQAFYELNLRWLTPTVVQGWHSHASNAELLLFSALEGSMIV